MPFQERLDVLVCYDVNTIYENGQRRLRRVAKVCIKYGQRVQYSVFECNVSMPLLFEMQQKLFDIMDPVEDSLRIYTLAGARTSFVKVFGRNDWVDFQKPLTI